jgi:hypothetical protein
MGGKPVRQFYDPQQPPPQFDQGQPVAPQAPLPERPLLRERTSFVFNPGRALASAAIVIVCLLVWWLTKHIHVKTIVLDFGQLDQLHTVAALAIAGITIVGLARLFRR